MGGPIAPCDRVQREVYRGQGARRERSLGEEETENGMILPCLIPFLSRLRYSHVSDIKHAKTARPAEETWLTPSLAETGLACTVAVLAERDSLWSVAVAAGVTVAVDDDAEIEPLDVSVAEEADAVPDALATLLETTDPSGRDAIGWRSSLAPQLFAVSQPVLYSSSHQDDWVTR